MSLLDRYIARQYLINIVLLMLILFCFVVAIDVSLNIDRFVRIAGELARSEGNEDSTLRRGIITIFLIADLWGPRLLQLFNYMLGLVLIGAMGFTCTQMVRHREFVAMLASGQGLHRVARPILITAIALSALQALNQEILLPRVAPLLTRDHGDAGQRSLGASAVPLTADGLGRLFYARSFDADAGTVEGLYIWERDAVGLQTRRIYAPRAQWNNGGWDLTDAVAKSTMGHDPQPESILRIETDLDPNALKMRRFAGYAQNLSWPQIGQMLARPELLDEINRDGLLRIQYGRISLILTNLLALAITLPFFLQRMPIGMLNQSLKCAPVAIAAMIGGLLGASAPIPGVPAQLGVFVPVMILIPVAIAMATSVKS